MCACVLSRFSCVRLFATSWIVTQQDPLSMGFSCQEYWTGLLYPPPGDLPNPGIEPRSLLSPTLPSRFFTMSTTWQALTDTGRCHSCHVIPAPALWWVRKHTQVLARTSSHKRTQATAAEAKPAYA